MQAIKKERERKKSAKNCIKEIEPGKIALASSDVWSFDVWYEEAPIVVAYFPSKESITLGLCPKTGGTLGDRSGFDVIGPEGLNIAYPLLDEKIMPGFGGRDVVGGSPRGTKMTFEHAGIVYQIIKEEVRKRNP